MFGKSLIIWFVVKCRFCECLLPSSVLTNYDGTRLYFVLTRGQFIQTEVESGDLSDSPTSFCVGRGTRLSGDYLSMIKPRSCELEAPLPPAPHDHKSPPENRLILLFPPFSTLKIVWAGNEVWLRRPRWFSRPTWTLGSLCSPSLNPRLLQIRFGIKGFDDL